MSIGGGISLIVVGAILAFAVEVQLAGLNLDVLGVILMIAGLVGVVLALTGARGRARSGPVTEERPVSDDRDG